MNLLILQLIVQLCGSYNYQPDCHKYYINCMNGKLPFTYPGDPAKALGQYVVQKP